jgi:hypothetical protein
MVRLQPDTTPSFFYSLVPYRTEEMTHEELVVEMQNIQESFDQYAKSGQGISAKERKRFNDCRTYLIRKTFGENGDVRALEKQLAQFFAPVEE